MAHERGQCILPHSFAQNQFKGIKCSTSWGESSVLSVTEFFSSSSAPRGDTSRVAALRFLTAQKASCSLSAQILLIGQHLQSTVFMQKGTVLKKCVLVLPRMPPVPKITRTSTGNIESLHVFLDSCPYCRNLTDQQHLVGRQALLQRQELFPFLWKLVRTRSVKSLLPRQVVVKATSLMSVFTQQCLLDIETFVPFKHLYHRGFPWNHHPLPATHTHTTSLHSHCRVRVIEQRFTLHYPVHLWNTNITHNIASQLSNRSNFYLRDAAAPAENTKSPPPAPQLPCWWHPFPGKPLMQLVCMLPALPSEWPRPAVTSTFWSDNLISSCWINSGYAQENSSTSLHSRSNNLQKREQASVREASFLTSTAADKGGCISCLLWS